jgi:hypothetical protein
LPLALQAAASDRTAQVFLLAWKELYQVDLSNKALADERSLL